MRSIRRWSMAVGAALTALTLLSATAAAAYSADVVIRKAPAGRSPQVTDVATAGQRVVVGWVEGDTPDGDDPKARIRESANGGQTWGPVRLVEPDNARELHLAICEGRYLYGVFAVDLSTAISPNRWSIVVYMRDLVTGNEWSEQLSFGTGVARDPDVACGTDRVWVGWSDAEPGDPRHTKLTHAVIEAPGPHGWSLPPMDLGEVDSSAGGVSIAAVTGHAYVAWPNADGDRIRFKRYTVGGGPAYPIGALPTTTFGAGGNPLILPLLAATGPNVGLAYVGHGMRFRHSDDHGANFDPSVELELPDPLGGFPESLAMRGSVVLVTAPVFFAGQADTYRFRSNDGGDSFKAKALGDNRGHRFGGLTGPRTDPKVVEAWDGWLYNLRKVWFHRQL